MGRAEGRKLEQELLSEHSDLELWWGEEKYPSSSTLIKIENESFDQNTFTTPFLVIQTGNWKELKKQAINFDELKVLIKGQ